MIENKELSAFLKGELYDIRKTNNGRWIDQKCTPDVVCIVADCVMRFLDEKGNAVHFTKNDIWRSPYAKDNVRDIFGKPSTSNDSTKNEYDKFFAQPLEMLASAKILSKIKSGRENRYTVNDLKILEYVSIRERNALRFITMYIEETMRQSGIWHLFEDFFDKQNLDSFNALKEKYETFIIDNTKINRSLEPRRIFTKILNPVAFDKKKKGTRKGFLSKTVISYAELMYNRDNFRYVNTLKPKGISREEWEQKEGLKPNMNFYKYQSNKAKAFVRRFNDSFRDSKSEIQDEYSAGLATQIHHIFPEHQFPEISMFHENLAALTATQHLYKAHPNNKTKLIDYGYQEILLKAKSAIIEDTINKGLDVYDFFDFVHVLNIGFGESHDVHEKDFLAVASIITEHYINRF